MAYLFYFAGIATGIAVYHLYITYKHLFEE